MDSRKLNTMQQAQILTHIRDGGFGLGNSAAIAPAAYVASVTTSRVSRTFKHYDSTLSIPWVNTRFATASDKLFDSRIDKPEIQRLLTQSKDKEVDCCWLSLYVVSIVSLKDVSNITPRLTNLFVSREVAFLMSPRRYRRTGGSAQESVVLFFIMHASTEACY